MMECTADESTIDVGTVTQPLVDAAGAFSAVSEAETGALDVISWPRGGKTITRRPLLSAPAEPSSTRRWVNGDGVLVVRAPRGGEPGVLVDVEVAWWTASTGVVRRAKLPKAAKPTGKWGTPNGMGVIVPGYGAYVRLAGAVDATTFIARENGAVSRTTLPPAFPALQRVSARRSGNSTVFVGTDGTSERVLMLASLADAGALTTHAWGLWPIALNPRSEVSLGGDHVALTWPGSAAIAPRHWMLPLDDPGAEPPEPLALPIDLSALPACAKGATGPRVELAWTLGHRTPVVIKHGKRVVHHATLATTVRASAKGSCVSGQIAGAPNVAGAEWTILPSDDPSHGFLVTRVGKHHVIAPLTCAKSSLSLPNAFVGARGFVE
jgi:hypothetical protein